MKTLMDRAAALVSALVGTATPVITDPWFALVFGLISGFIINLIASIYFTTRWQDWADRARRRRAANVAIGALAQQLGIRTEGRRLARRVRNSTVEQLEAVARTLLSRASFLQTQQALSATETRTRDDCRITGLDHAGSSYDVDELVIIPSELRLVAACPLPLQQEILKRDPEYQFRPACSLDGSRSFEDIADSTGISALPSLIREHSELVGRRVLDSLDRTRPIFNNGKFGVASIRFDRRGQHERQALRLETFETDYFTHLVFRSIYRELKQSGHGIAGAHEADLIRYRPFLTSFGVNTFVILDNAGIQTIVFSKRSPLLASGQGAMKWHVTMNEGLSLTDYDEGRRSVSVFRSAERGLWEELGLIRGRYREAKFYDVFLELEMLEIGITSTVRVPTTFTDFTAASDKAPDRHFESIEFLQILYSEDSLTRFLREQQGMITGAGLYAARMLTARGCPF
jgi:hypothetical protein